MSPPNGAGHHPLPTGRFGPCWVSVGASPRHRSTALGPLSRTSVRRSPCSKPLRIISTRCRDEPSPALRARKYRVTAHQGDHGISLATAPLPLATRSTVGAGFEEVDPLGASRLCVRRPDAVDSNVPLRQGRKPHDSKPALLSVVSFDGQQLLGPTRLAELRQQCVDHHDGRFLA